jgi:hypothetical protein
LLLLGLNLLHPLSQHLHGIAIAEERLINVLLIASIIQLPRSKLIIQIARLSISYAKQLCWHISYVSLSEQPLNVDSIARKIFGGAIRIPQKQI